MTTNMGPTSRNHSKLPYVCPGEKSRRGPTAPETFCQLVRMIMVHSREGDAYPR